MIDDYLSIMVCALVRFPLFAKKHAFDQEKVLNCI